jgi:EAL domain-containing protein (putative c-di-GMP-specific phosphodiesterase class I)
MSERPRCQGQCADQSQFSIAMAFQPVVDLPNRTIIAYEALVRGKNGESAASVMSVLTDQNRYAFDQACRVKAIETAAKLGLDRRLNINFMPNAVYHPEACLRLTLECAEANRFPLDKITFEFTEDERMVDRQHLKAIVTAYKRFGFLTALDDFGAGYAGLSLLADFQPDYVKLDRSLIADIHEDAPRRAIIAGILTTVRALGLSVVAEGVEKIEELAVLTEFGLTKFQGYLFARPALETLIGDEAVNWP